MLQVKDLTKKFGHYPAVDRVNFTIRRGEIVGYLGPNGAGKSTTIKMLSGLLEPTEGEIFYNDKNIYDDLISYKGKLGYVPEESEIYPHLSGFEYLQMVGRLRGLEENIITEKAEQLLELFKLYGSMHFYISSYSKGMRQKILIIAALLHNPEILLLDEPLSGLDVATVLVFKEVLRKLAGVGKVILYSSHILEVVENLCDRVIIIHKGKILADDSVKNLKELSKKPSLEEVFSNLVLKEDTEKIADEMFKTIVG